MEMVNPRDKRSEKRLILGTAGHIDHGKTALVKSLTGVDTDRLREEKVRGITIDLGFAELEAREGLHLGVVDVPGHEGFIRNMLAGATGMDLVLLVIASDEGMMPQTREHLDIVRLLGITEMVVALTKTDLVEEEWLTLVEEEVREVLEESPFSGAPMVRTSTVTGRGIDELVGQLMNVAQRVCERSNDDVTRLPIDRAFTVRGTGTVVTGTLWSGKLSLGENVTLQPAGITGRVRGLQVHGIPVERAGAGERTAVAITGTDVDLGNVERGQVMVAEKEWTATSMLTVLLNVLDDTGWIVKHGQRVRVHLGTTEVMARVITLEGHEILPGGVGWAQIRLERPIMARARDRFVIRSYSPVTTIGGGTVAEVTAPKRKKLLRDEGKELLAMIDGTPTEALAAVLSVGSWAGVPVSEIPIRIGASPVESSTAKAEVVKHGARETADDVYGAVTVERARTFIEEAVDINHRDHPLRWGISVELLRKTVPTRGESRLADLLLGEAVNSGSLEVQDGVVSRPGYEPSLDAHQREVKEDLLAIYRSAGLAPPVVSELPDRVRMGPDLWPLLKLLERERHLVGLNEEFFVDALALSAAKSEVKSRLAGATGLGPADFRKVLRVTRKHLIPLLSYFDRTGITSRHPGGRDVIAVELNQ